MDELNEEIKLTIHTMQTDIDDGAHDELQGHLYSLLEMKRNELQQRMTERSWSAPATHDDLSPYKTVIKPCGQIADEAKPLLTTEELEAGGWWCADVSKECADALKSKGLRVLNSDEWTSDGAHSGCVMDDSDDCVTRCFFDFSNKKQIKRIGNDFYWCKP